jgi:hypothetical protein
MPQVLVVYKDMSFYERSLHAFLVVV